MKATFQPHKGYLLAIYDQTNCSQRHSNKLNLSSKEHFVRIVRNHREYRTIKSQKRTKGKANEKK